MTAYVDYNWSVTSMACILFVRGRDWDVDGFASHSRAAPDHSWRKGEWSQGPGSYRAKVSGMSWTLVDGFVLLSRQVEAATKFLEDANHRRWLRAAAREPGVERTLEFGLTRQTGPVPADYLPARLLALVARYDFDIVLSHYPVKVETRRERRNARKAR